MAYSKVSQLKQSQTDVEAQRVKLDVASGYKDRKDIDRQNEEFFSLANMTGSDAMSLVDSYSQMMKTLQAIGLSSEKSFDLYKNMSLFAKSTGADSQQMSRAGYAIGQIYGKGFVSREELQLQLADALPSFRRYLMDVYAKETGNSSFESFDKALTDKKITTQMLEQAFREAAKAGMPNVQQYANTAQGMENQYANQVLQEQMRRTLDDEMVPAAKRFTQAQGELYKATAPLRNAMYDLSAGALSAAANLVSWSAKALENSPAMAKQASYEQRSEAVMASSMGRGLLSVPNITKLQEKPRQPITPMLYKRPDWQKESDRYMPKLSADWGTPAAKLEQMLAKQDPLKVLALQDVSRWNKPPALSMPSTASITKLQEKPRQPITPMLYPKPEWQQAAEQYAPSSPDALMQQFTQRSNVSVQSSVSFQQGAFQIQTQATDAQTLAAELQPLIQEQFDVSLQRTLSEVDASFGSK